MGWEGTGQDGMGWDGTGWDGMGRDGMGWNMGWDRTGWDAIWDGTGRDRMGWDVTGQDGTGWDGTGRDGMGWDGTGCDGIWDGTGRDGMGWDGTSKITSYYSVYNILGSRRDPFWTSKITSYYSVYNILGSGKGSPRDGPGGAREAILGSFWDPRKVDVYMAFTIVSGGSVGGPWWGGVGGGFADPPLHSRAANIKLKLRIIISLYSSQIEHRFEA